MVASKAEWMVGMKDSTLVVRLDRKMVGMKDCRMLARMDKWMEVMKDCWMDSLKVEMKDWMMVARKVS